MITVAELRIGVLVAEGPARRASRLATLEAATRDHRPLPVDHRVAEAFAGLVAQLRAAERNPRVLNTLIAATASAHDTVVVIQDDDFDELPGVTGLEV